MNEPFVLLTCEHGGNKIPKAYQNYFRNQKRVLASHRGWDIGALGVAKMISKKMRVPIYFSETSRLLVDLNRSLDNKNLFSEFVKNLSERDQERILKKYYFPHQIKLQNQVNEHSRILHLAIHSFTPVLDGKTRNTDLGLLFDPKSTFEQQFANLLKSRLNSYAPELRVRMNYPYKGTSDGISKNLRKAFGLKKYAGIEIEMNQNFFIKNETTNQKRFARLFAQTISEVKELIQ